MMQKIGNLFGERCKQPPEKDRKTERGELIQYFHDRVNETRDGKKYKKLKMGFFAAKLSHLSLTDLYYFKRVCEDAKDFSKYFWWSLDEKKNHE